VPDVSSDEPKRVSQCGMALKCCVWRYSNFVSQIQYNGMSSNKLNPANFRINRFSNRKRMIIIRSVDKKSHCTHELSILGTQHYLKFFFHFCCFPIPTASVPALRRLTPLRHTRPVARRNFITPAVHLPLYATLCTFPITLSLSARPCPEQSVSDSLSHTHSGRD
jgi:hypothetical protein